MSNNLNVWSIIRITGGSAGSISFIKISKVILFSLFLWLVWLHSSRGPAKWSCWTFYVAVLGSDIREKWQKKTLSDSWQWDSSEHVLNIFPKSFVGEKYALFRSQYHFWEISVQTKSMPCISKLRWQLQEWWLRLSAKSRYVYFCTVAKIGRKKQKNCIRIVGLPFFLKMSATVICSYLYTVFLQNIYICVIYKHKNG